MSRENAQLENDVEEATEAFNDVTNNGVDLDREVRVDARVLARLIDKVKSTLEEKRPARPGWGGL